MTRLIDADAFADDLEYDVELCARALDDMNMVGKERDDMQFEKDCKQNCIWYISEQPTVDAIPIDFIKSEIQNSKGFYNSSLRRLLDVWTERKEEDAV